MRRWQGYLLLATSIASIVLVFGVVYGMRQGQASHLEILAQAPSFSLIDQNNQPVSSRAFRGKVIVADFIYTHCPAA